MNPADHTVTAIFTPSDLANFTGSSSDAALVIAKEDASATYTGVMFFAPANVSTNTGAATLSATITDMNDITPRGDIRNAKVTFVYRDSADAPITGCINLPVGLVNLADPTTGTVTCQPTLTTGSQDSQSYLIGIIVSGYYTRNNSGDNTVVTIYKPNPSDFITGGGHLILSSSNGLYRGDAGSKNNFGFNVKYKPGKNPNPQGNLNVIIRRTVGGVQQKFQIKSNSIESSLQ